MSLNGEWGMFHKNSEILQQFNLKLSITLKCLIRGDENIDSWTV